MQQCNISWASLRKDMYMFVQFIFAQCSRFNTDVCKTVRDILVMMILTLIEKQVSQFIC